MPKKISKLKLAWIELKYWRITRHTQKFVPWVARKLPTKLKYFVVIDGMVKVQPNEDPSHVNAMDILDLWEPKH